MTAKITLVSIPGFPLPDLKTLEKEYFALEKKVLYAETFEQKNRLKKELWAKYEEIQNYSQR